jgi:hypothetical protein
MVPTAIKAPVLTIHFFIMVIIFVNSLLINIFELKGQIACIIVMCMNVKNMNTLEKILYLTISSGLRVCDITK